MFSVMQVCCWNGTVPWMLLPSTSGQRIMDASPSDGLIDVSHIKIKKCDEHVNGK